MSPVVLVGACVGAAYALKEIVSGPHHHGGGRRVFGGGYSYPFWQDPVLPLAPCPPGYGLDAYGRCMPLASVAGLGFVPQVAGPLTVTISRQETTGQQTAARYCYGRRVL